MELECLFVLNCFILQVSGICEGWAWVSEFESTYKVRTNWTFAMISKSKEGLIEVSKKWKKSKIEGCGTTFTKLGAFLCGCEEGCMLIRVLVLKVCDLESQLSWYFWWRRDFELFLKKRWKRSHRWSLTCLGGWCVENKD